MSKELIFDQASFNYGSNIDLTTQGDPNDNAGWTTLTNQGGGSSKVLAYAKYYLTDGSQGEGSPEVEAGNTIYLKNGNFGQNLWNLIDSTIQSEGSMQVVVPVVDKTKFNQGTPIIGFAYYVATGHENKGNGSKGWEKHVLHGYFSYIKTVDAKEVNGQHGPVNFGVRVNNAALIN